MNNESLLKNTRPIGYFRFIAFAISVLMTATAGAQRTLTISQAIKGSFANRKAVQAGKTNLAIRELQTAALYRKYWPEIAVSYNYLYNPILQTSILPIGVFNPTYPADATKSVQFGTKWSQAAGVMVTQPLLDVTIRRQTVEAKLQERIASATQAQTEYELAYDIARVYIDISLQESKIKSAIADTSRTWVSYQMLLNKYEQKRLLKSELNKSKVNHNNAIQQYNDAVSQLIEDKVYLLYLTGEHEIDHPDFAIDMEFMTDELQSTNNTQLSVAAIPELQELQLKGEMSAVQKKTEQARHLPTVNMKGYLGANQYTNNFDPIAANSWFGLSYVGLDLKYPLFNGEHKQKKMQQLQLQSEQYYQQKEDKTVEYYKDALMAKIKMERMLKELKTLEENIALYTESISILQARVQEGQETAATLNSEEVELQKIDAGYQSGKRQYWLYLLDYLNATGKLDLLWSH